MFQQNSSEALTAKMLDYAALSLSLCFLLYVFYDNLGFRTDSGAPRLKIPTTTIGGSIKAGKAQEWTTHKRPELDTQSKLFGPV